MFPTFKMVFYQRFKRSLFDRIARFLEMLSKYIKIYLMGKKKWVKFWVILDKTVDYFMFKSSFPSPQVEWN